MNRLSPSLRKHGLKPLLCSLIVLLVAVGGCKEEGPIEVRSLEFTGVNRVREPALREALAIRPSSKLPWGSKRFFERQQFDADLVRLRAFYVDRGFPHARVTGFDARLSEKQDSIDLTVNVSEGEPLVLTALTFTGFDVIPADRQRTLRDSLPLLPGRPLDRQLAVASRERALNALRDDGYPYAEVTLREEETGPKQRRLIVDAVPGVLAHFGEIDIRGYASVSEHVIRRQLTFTQGDRFTRREMRESQRKLDDLDADAARIAAPDTRAVAVGRALD